MNVFLSISVFLTVLFSISITGAAPITRVPNDSLRLPAELPEGSFTTENLFPNIRFSRPVALVVPPGETNRLFVLEQAGIISVIPDLESPSKETFLDLQESTRFQGESGLLGLAFHPNYTDNGFFYVFYTARGAGLVGRVQRVARFEVDPSNPNRARRQSEQPMIDQFDEASNHNGGDLQFGPDGYLYISLGDEGGANDQYDNARFLDKDFFAGILRIDVDQLPGSLKPNDHPAAHADTYTIPADNPFVDTKVFLGRSLDSDRVRTEFWAVGLRNPWRMAFDPVNGRLYCGDVGQGAREEIDIIEKGKHYGWSLREGERSFTAGPSRTTVPDGFSPAEPIYDYARGDGISITGGVVYRGEAHTELFEAYIFADYGSGRIWSLHHRDNHEVAVKQIARDASVSAFGTDPRNGDVLFAAYASGQVKRIARKSSGFALLVPKKLSQTGAFADVESLTPNPGLVAYEPNVSFWSDGALKQRWFAVPNMDETITTARDAPWSFPTGSTWVKHFELELTSGDPSSRRRLETRFLVKTKDGSYGLTYRWNEEQNDADLVDSDGMEETFEIMENGAPRSQTWRYPSRNECRACHTQVAGHALSFNTRQLNRDYAYPDETTNQLLALDQAGYFTQAMEGHADLPSYNEATLEERVRAYLAVNCAQCHQPGGPALGFWDARAHLPLDETGVVNGELVADFGNADRRVIVPGSEADSMLLIRLLGEPSVVRMPPIGSHELDQEAIELMRGWIATLGGAPAPLTYETWASQFNLDNANREADADRDGQSNHQEFLADTDPTSASDFWRAAVQRVNDQWSLTFPALPNGSLDLETSTDAKVWQVWPDDLSSDPAAILLDTSDAKTKFFRFRLEP